MAIGNNLKNILKDKGISIQDFSKDTGISINTLYGIIKRDNKTVKPDILKKITKQLDITPTYLLGWDTPGEEYIPMQDRMNVAKNLGLNPLDVTGIDPEIAKSNPEYLSDKLQEITKHLENDIRVKFEKDMLDKMITGYNQLNFNGKCKASASIEALTKLPELQIDYKD